MKRIFITSLLSISFLLGVNAQKINQQESKVEFKIGTMGFSSVKGEISGMKGLVKFDKNNLSTSSFDVTVSPKTINTDNEKRDIHLKNEDFFNVEKYLNVKFRSSSIIKNGNGYLAKGKLTILETTKEIALPFTITKNGNKTIFEGELEINRFDYALGSEEYKTSIMVGETADVKIICVIE